MKTRAKRGLWAAGGVAVAATGLVVARTLRQSRRTALETVAHVDLDRFVGTWFEIARFPRHFEAGCAAVTATYTKRDDGSIVVENTCRKGAPAGPLSVKRGVAHVVDAESNAKLAVKFFPLVSAPFWIIDVDDDYRWAVVSEPRMKSLWILSREPTLDDDVFRVLCAKLDARGFDLRKLKRTVQPH